MSLLVRPNQVELSFTVRQGVVLTRVVVYQGIHLREVVTGLNQVLVRIDVAIWGHGVNTKTFLSNTYGVAFVSVSCHLRFGEVFLNFLLL